MEKVSHLISANAAVVGLLFLAFVVTMPEEPPSNLKALPGWCYRWLRDGLKTFVSFRAPAAPKKDP